MILGVDPGQTGGIATWSANPRAIAVFRNVTKSTRRIGKPDKIRPDPYALAELFSLLADMVDFAVVEKVSGRSGQGGAPSWTFGRACGVLEGCIASAGIEIREVPPSVWKPRLLVPSDGNGARARASELIPEGAHLWPLAGDHDLAEAGLLAYFGHHFPEALSIPFGDAPQKKRRRRGRLKFA